MGLDTSRISGRFRFFSRDVIALFYAMRDPAAPLQAKLIAALAILYAFSPIDLVPDFIPVMGLLDDIILVPLGLALAFRLMPTVMAAARTKAQLRFATLKHAGAFLLAGSLILVLVVAAAWHWF